MLEANTPASAWKPSRGDGDEQAVDPAAVDDDVGASTVKGCASVGAREMPTATPVPVPRSGDDSTRHGAAPSASPTDERETAWWGEALAARRGDPRGDPEAGRDRDTAEDGAASSRDDRSGALPEALGAPPFSAARTARGRLAGDGAVRCFACGGEYTRNEMVLLWRCGHPLCLSCAEAWAERRGRRCPTCKSVFDGWHFGARAAPAAHAAAGAFGGWRVAFHALEPEPAGDVSGDGNARKRKPARSARALAFDGPDSAPELAGAAGGSSAGKRRRRSAAAAREMSAAVSPERKRLRCSFTDDELEDADEDELLAMLREAGGASFQTPAAARRDAR